MNGTTTTFINFIKSHNIQIPLIQRDYVQGIALDEKAVEKRDEFIKKLLDAILPGGKPYTLDFIYGARESYDASTENPNAPFLPLDGQQRLTTLFLLHWIMAIKNNLDGKYNFVLELLKKFSYKTRISSDKFFRKLLDSSFDKDKSLYDQIMDKTWYVDDLKVDLTIMAIMEMVKQMESKLKTEPYSFYLKDMATLLFEKECITFSILDMEKYHLTDGLYVKMNARGKELTQFENWKADFIKLISNDESIKDTFTTKIEHEWNDLFWHDVYTQYAKEIDSEDDDERGNKAVKYPRIDEHFMNFFTNVSRLLFFRDSRTDNSKAEDFKGNVWNTTESLYGNNSQNINTLFHFLDKLTEIDNKEGIEKFFNDLLYIGSSTKWDTFDTRVKLFDCEDTNLFKYSFSSNDFKWQHVLLYAVLLYCCKYDISTVTLELKRYTRICRDYLYQHNYLDTGKVTIVSQIRANDMRIYDKVFNYLTSNQNPIDSLKQTFTGEDSKYLIAERAKSSYYDNNNTDLEKLFIKIEDMSYTHGSIGAFSNVLNDCLSGILSCQTVWNATYSFHQASALEKVQLFIAFNYEGIIIGNDCAYGKRVFLGGEYGGLSRWEVHFRKNEEKMKEWLSAYVKAFVEKANVQQLISVNTPLTTIPTSLREYMLKYPLVLASQLWWRDDVNEAPFYYAMPNPWNDYDAIVIHSFSNRPLGNAYQTCPMANAVARTMNNYDNAHMGYSGQGSRKEGIMIHNGDWSKVYFSLKFAQTEWIISNKSFNILSPSLKKKTTPIKNNENEVTHYVLSIPENVDLIEGAIGFMQEVVEFFKENNYFN